ncbi:MAG: hypothetical protein PVH85_10705 [Desulfobacterales bacterium]
MKRALIIGGGNIGFRQAGSLEGNGLQCQIIVKNPERCTEIDERLNKTVVLLGEKAAIIHKCCPSLIGAGWVFFNPER